MKTAVLFGIGALAAMPALAQTPAPASADSRTVTLTGCVGGGAGTTPITLSNAMVIPGTSQPGEIDRTPSPIPPPVSSAPTEPVPPATPAIPSPTGTSGTKTPPTAGTSGVVTGTAPAGSSGSSVTGYRLSGVDMQPWIGRRVQVIGTFVPATAPTPGVPTSATTAASGTPSLEFKVQTVLPATGPCR